MFPDVGRVAYGTHFVPRGMADSLRLRPCPYHNSRFVPVLSLAVTGVLAGWRSPTAIWEHVTDLTAASLRSLGLAAGQTLPSETTIRRVLQDLDPADADAHLRSRPCLSWLQLPSTSAVDIVRREVLLSFS